MNEHIRVLRHGTDTVEAKIYKVIMFYNNSIHSTTSCKPIDFNNGNIIAEEKKEKKNKLLD